MVNKPHSDLTGIELHEPKSHTHDTLYLKRSADDFNGVGVEKGSPANADRVLIEDSADGLAKKWAQVGNLPGGGGSSTWTGLSDTASSFTGHGGKYVKVNTGATALEFDTPGGSGDMTKTIYDPNDDGVIATAQLDTGVFLVNGTRTMTGNLNMGDQYITDANRMQAHDGAGVGFVTNASVTMIRMAYDTYAFQAYADADMNSNKLLNVTDPTSAQDAATKKYVDDTTGSWEVSGTELQMATARGMGMQGEDILYTGDVVPQTNNLSNLGTASYLWANVFATTVIAGDLGFSEKECHVCKEKFKVGDVIDLIIKSIESHGIMTVPVHKECNR